MNTWWIVKLKYGGVRLIISAVKQRCSAGPYWTVTEALDMIEKWK